MSLLTKGSEAARTSLVYITLGALVLVWTGVRLVYLLNTTPAREDNMAYYWCAGFLATGLVLLLIGFGLGRIGRAARHAELPPPEVTQAMANAEQNATARVPMVGANPVAPALMPGAQPVVPSAPVAAVAPTAPPVASAPVVPQTPVRT
jgi:hypothetical protein